MIPFALLMLKLHYDDGTTLEARALELPPDGIVYRVPCEFSAKPASVECGFYDPKSGRYDIVTVTDIHIEERDSELGRAFYMTSSSPAFLSDIRRLAKDYTRYIDIKLSLDENEAARELTGLDIPDRYALNAAEWRQSLMGGTEYPDTPLPHADIAYCAGTPSERRAFLTNDLAGYRAYHLDRCALAEHPVSLLPFTHIYIGSDICPLLLPDEYETVLCAEKALSEGLAPVLDLPFMPDSRAKMYLGLIKAFSGAVHAHGAAAEILINDIGTALMLRDEGFDMRMLSLTAGPLIARRRRDPRAEAAGRDMTGPSPADTPFFREYLRSLGFTRISGIDEICLPLNIMNLSSFCTTRAYIEYGDRGRGTEDTACPHYCEDSAFIYPDGLNAIGIGGAIFEADTELLNDTEKLNALIRGGVDRIVLR